MHQQLYIRILYLASQFLLLPLRPLTNRVRGPYRKLRTEFFPPRFMAQALPGHKSKGKKRGSVTYNTDRENEVSKIFIISLVCLRGSGTILIHAERLQISDAPRKQNQSI